MKLYIINEVLRPGDHGMALLSLVIAAESLEKAASLFANEWPEARLIGEFNTAIERGAYKVLEVIDEPEGIVSYIYIYEGGGAAHPARDTDDEAELHVDENY